MRIIRKRRTSRDSKTRKCKNKEERKAATRWNKKERIRNIVTHKHK